MKRVDHAKQKFPCNKRKQLGHWAAECPQKQQHAGDRGGKSAAKNADGFPTHVMGVSTASSVDADNWYRDSGETQHMRPNKHYLHHTQNLLILKRSCLARKTAYGQGMINVQMFHKGMWHDTTLKKSGMCQMQTHTYSPSRQPPKTATA